jgi:hypothetical protein
LIYRKQGELSTVYAQVFVTSINEDIYASKKIALITHYTIAEAFTGFSPWISQYNPMVACVESVVDKAAWGRIFSKHYGFPCQSFHSINAP